FMTPFKSLFVFLCLLILPAITFSGEQSTLRLVSYNTWGLPTPFLICPGRFEKISKEIGQFKADIVSFQETFTKHANVLSKIAEFPYRLYGPPKGGKKLKILHSGLLLLSKYPIVQSDYKIYSKCGGFDCFANKGIMWAKINVPGIGDINVFNTHTNAGSSNKIKTSQLVEAWDFIQAHLGGRSTVFMGDMNFAPGSELYNYVQYNMNFEDSLDLYLNDHPEYSNDPNVLYTYIIKLIYKRRLDYFWLKDIGPRSMHPTNYKVIFNNINGTRLSDHFGIMMDLKFH
ncbi:MAG: endonuclease/exonuclease/phosphatase family protein, partial [Bdellovibrionota bacterium]